MALFSHRHYEYLAQRISTIAYLSYTDKALIERFTGFFQEDNSLFDAEKFLDKALKIHGGKNK